ncbi:hypothetical protein [Aquibacillus kalidii]|nr:hypothetical protein [Aquibacillus kalidii]
MINDAIDWKGEVMPRNESSIIEFGTMDVEVKYENKKEIYFQSGK